MTAPIDAFKFCPGCGRALPERGQPNRVACASCGFVYYFSPALAAVGIVRDSEDRVLLTRRAHDPAKGKLGLVGGFIDFRETAEDALIREVREEVNLELTGIEYFCSQVNEYLYAGITYPVLDVFFIARAVSPERVAALDGIESFCWVEPGNIDIDSIAFPSVRKALALYVGHRRASKA